jgi:hypothetical protein
VADVPSGLSLTPLETVTQYCYSVQLKEKDKGRACRGCRERGETISIHCVAYAVLADLRGHSLNIDIFCLFIVCFTSFCAFV